MLQQRVVYTERDEAIPRTHRPDITSVELRHGDTFLGFVQFDGDCMRVFPAVADWHMRANDFSLHIMCEHAMTTICPHCCMDALGVILE
jgi:hypothetical protein